MSHHESAARGPDARMVDRLLFFSDAVFAIVLTLLILDLHPPALGGLQGDAAWNALFTVAPNFWSFLLSFAIVGMWWSLHMRVTRSFARFDGLTAFFNFVFLLSIALMPFVAGLLGESRGHSAEAFVVYWGVNAAASFAMALLSFFATRGGGKFLIQPISGGARVFFVYANIAPAIVFSASIWLALQGRVNESAMATALIPVLIGLGRIFYRPKKEVKA